MQGPHRSGPVSIVARRAGVGLVGGGKKPFSRSSCARARSSISWALSGTTSTTATSPAIASAPGPGPRLPPDAGTGCRRDRRARRSCRSSLGSRHAPAAIGSRAGFPACRFGGLSSPPKCPAVPVSWCARTVLGTDSPRNRQARQPALRTQGQLQRYECPLLRVAPFFRPDVGGCRRM